MALYRKGEAELKENGQVIGYGTGWQDQLALIRVGATMVFLSGEKPVLGVISAIESPEKMTVVDYDGQVAARGKYLILLHDSITVEGLAQDVAETLRYYQSKETEIADALDYFKTFDWKKLEAIQADVKANADKSDQSAASASQSEVNASVHAGNANRDAQIATDKAASASDSQAKAAESEKFSEQYMNNAKELAASASLSASAAKGSEDKVAADAKTASQASAAALQSEQNSNQHRIAAEAAQSAAQTSEANSKQSEQNAYEHRVAADASDKSAAGSASTASNDAAKATEQADRAQRLADSINPESMMKKENNLSDVADVRTSVNNLGLGWLDRVGGNAVVASPDGSKRLVIGNDGLFVWQDNEGNTIPIAITSGGTGATTKEGARDNFGLGSTQDVRFANVEASLSGQPNGGIFNSKRLNSDGSALVSGSRFYNEVQAGISKSTIHTFNANGNKNNYIQIDESGNVVGVNALNASSTITAARVRTSNEIMADQGASVGLSTQSGGNKNIIIQNINGDGSANGWVNLLQGNWYNGYWQLGAIRGNGADIDMVQLGINNQGNDWKSFQFRNSYGGHIVSGKGFKGKCTQGSWMETGAYMGAPFYADIVTGNDGGWSPIVSGGTRSTGGYEVKCAFGAISGGTTSWPRATIHMLGDGQYSRGFEFYVSGHLYTWDSNNVWGGNFEFSRVPNSDRDLKRDINYDDGKASYENIMKMKPSTFIYKSDKYGRVRRGVIAQDMQQIDDEYVKIIPGAPIFDPDDEPNADGKRSAIDYHDDTLGLDDNVILLDTAIATRYIGVLVEKQKEEIDSLKSEVEELKALVKQLISK